MPCLKVLRDRGAALNYAYDRKIRQAWQACHDQGIEFVPLPVETPGGWHPTAIRVLNKLGRQVARHIGKDDAEIQQHMFQRLSILLMKGNAALISSRSPDIISQEVDGDADNPPNVAF